MQAIILAAGMGKRLGRLTEHNTKSMVKVNGKTLIRRMLNQLSVHPIQRVIVVTGHKGDRLKEHIGTSYHSIPIIYVTNPVYGKTNNIYSLFLAKNYLKEDDTILLESDIIMEDAVINKVLLNPYPNLAIVAAYHNRMNGTMVYLDRNDYITGYATSGKLGYKRSQLCFKTVNIYKFSKSFLINRYIPFLEVYIQSFGRNAYYEQILSVLSALDNKEMKGLPLSSEKWVEIDDLSDLQYAEAVFADKKMLPVKFGEYYGGYWRFPGLSDYCYLVNPFFPSENFKQLLASNFEGLLCRYPSGTNTNILSASSYFLVDSEYISVGNGAAELIKTLLAFLPGKTGTILPSFEEYTNCLEKSKNVSFLVANKDFSYTMEELTVFFDNKGIKNLIIVNPDNPSGNYISPVPLLLLIQWCEKKGINLIVDESFVDFSGQSEKESLLKNEILEKYPHLIVIKSISKSYGVPGLRLGILASGNKELVKKINRALPLWNINSFADFFLQNMALYKKDYILSHKLFVRERKRFYKELSQIPFLRVIPSQSNYFLCEVFALASHELTAVLLNDFNILIKDCSVKKGFGGKSFIRLAIKSRKENDNLIKCLKLINKSL